MTQSTPAGWYPQPDGSQRYWDGMAWTAHHQPVPPTQPAPGYSVAPYGQQPFLPQQVMIAPKNPALALLASFFIPGLGTIINGEGGKGAGILVGYVVAVVLSLFLIGIPFALGLWIWGMIDAYTGAQRWNAAHGIRS